MLPLSTILQIPPCETLTRCVLQYTRLLPQNRHVRVNVEQLMLRLGYFLTLRTRRAAGHSGKVYWGQAVLAD